MQLVLKHASNIHFIHGNHFGSLVSCIAVMVVFCIDIDECIEDIDDCAQICTDTDGSYTCSCRPGYRLASDDHQCDGTQCHVLSLY